MNTVQLTGLMDKISCNTNFLGVLPCDYLPEDPLKDTPCMLISNTQSSDEPGEHWIAIYIRRDGVACFFDSFGNAPDADCFPASFHNFLKNNSTVVQYSDKQVQDYTSDTCGQHCVFFLYYISRGYEYENIIKIYHNDLLKNDVMVSLFVKKLKPSLCNGKTFKCIQCVQSGKTFQTY